MDKSRWEIPAGGSERFNSDASGASGTERDIEGDLPVVDSSSGGVDSPPLKNF